MGNSESSSASPRYLAAARSFTPSELDNLSSLYTSLAAKSGSNGKHVSPDAFKAYIGIDGPLGDRVFDLVSQKRKDQRLTFEDLVIAKGDSIIALYPLSLPLKKPSTIRRSTVSLCKNEKEKVLLGKRI